MANDGAVNTQAGLARGGAGTLILTLADRLPPDYGSVKTLLIYSSPAISVLLAVIWIAFAAWLRRRKRRADMEALIEEGRMRRDSACADPNNSEAHKARTRRAFEELEQVAMDLVKDEANVLRAQLREIQ